LIENLASHFPPVGSHQVEDGEQAYAPCFNESLVSFGIPI
jgi:hypothetical protein